MESFTTTLCVDIQEKILFHGGKHLLYLAKIVTTASGGAVTLDGSETGSMVEEVVKI